MLQPRNRFQYEVATGQITLPSVIVLTLILFALSASSYTWGNFGSLLIFGIATYMLRETDTQFALIRTRTTLPASLFLLLFAAAPFLHTWNTAQLLLPLFIGMLFSLFLSYESPHASTPIFHAFFFLGLGSLLVPCIAWLMPLLYIHMISLRSLEGKTFFAGIIGFTLPYWFLLGYCLYTDQVNLFYSTLSLLTDFQAIDYATVPLERYIFWGVTAVLGIVYSIPYLRSDYKDKVQTRILLHILLGMGVWVNLLIALQPCRIDALLPLAFIPTVFMGGHLFSLTFNRFTRILFIATLIVWLLLCSFNLWIHFFNF